MKDRCDHYSGVDQGWYGWKCIKEIEQEQRSGEQIKTIKKLTKQEQINKFEKELKKVCPSDAEIKFDKIKGSLVFFSAYTKLMLYHFEIAALEESGIKIFSVYAMDNKLRTIFYKELEE